jgi:transaldolase
MSSVQRMQEMGQSVWLDDFNRELIASGPLAMLIAQGLTGVTTTPSIIARAITRLPEY